MSSASFLTAMLQTSIPLGIALVIYAGLRRQPALRYQVLKAGLAMAFAVLLIQPLVQFQKDPLIAIQEVPVSTSFVPQLSLETSRGVPIPSAEKMAATPAKTRPLITVGDSVALSPYSTEFVNLLPIWLGGTLIGMIGLVVGLLKLERIRYRSHLVASTAATAMLEDLANQAAIRTPELREGPHVTSPFAAGIFRSKIYLPAGWAAELDPQSLRTILAHEIAHIASFDLRWLMFFRFIKVAMWPNPLVWMFKRPLSSASEEVCDRRVLAMGLSEAEYADRLLAMVENLARKGCPSFGLGVVTSRSQLGKRIESLLDRRISPNAKLSQRLVGALAVASIFVVMAAARVVGRTLSPVLEPGDLGLVVKPYSFDIPIIGPDTQLRKPVATVILSDENGHSITKSVTIHAHHVSFDSSKVGNFFRGDLVVIDKDRTMGFARIWPAKQRLREIKLEKTVTIRGRALLPNGSSAKGLIVAPTLYVFHRDAGSFPSFLISSDYLNRFRSVTKSDGTFELRNMPSEASVAFDFPDSPYARLSFSERVNTSNQHATFQSYLIRLREAGTFSGQVMKDGKGVGGIRVVAQETNDEPQKPNDGHGETTTGPDGRYVIQKLSRGVYNVALDLQSPTERSLTAPAHERIAARPGVLVTHLDFNLTRGAILQGRVVNPSGEPVKHLYMGVYGPAHPRSGAMVQMTYTDDAGRFVFHVPGGSQHIYLGDDRFRQSSQDLEVKDGEKRIVNFTAEAKSEMEIKQEMNPR